MSEALKKTVKQTAVEKDEPKYLKVGLLAMSEFDTTDKDIMNIVLKDDESYTLAQVKQAIKQFKEGI